MPPKFGTIFISFHFIDYGLWLFQNISLLFRQQVILMLTGSYCAVAVHTLSVSLVCLVINLFCLLVPADIPSSFPFPFCDLGRLCSLVVTFPGRLLL